MRISDWSSDVCSSDLARLHAGSDDGVQARRRRRRAHLLRARRGALDPRGALMGRRYALFGHPVAHSLSPRIHAAFAEQAGVDMDYTAIDTEDLDAALAARSEEHTSELQSLMRISYAVFCLK